MTKPSLIADLTVRLNEDRRYEFEERAGIIEFDGGLPRDDAELLALVDLLREHPGALVGVTAWEVSRNGQACIALVTNASRLQATGFTAIAPCDLAAVLDRDFGGVARLVRIE